jgi:predicted permease
MLLVAFLPISPIIKYTVFFLMSMPSATSTTLFAVKFKGDAENGAVMVLLSSILCVATIPLMFLIFSGLFGVTI